MNIKVISRNVGYALLVSALFMFFSILVSINGGNDSALAALLVSFVITFTAGSFPLIFVRKTHAITLKDGYMIIVLSWTLSFIFGMLPYLLWGGPFTVINALYESVSGYTTTGGTILDDIEALPRSLLFWRSSTHFIGGLGIVVFLLLIIPSSSPVKLRLANMEVSSLSKDSYRSRANKTVYIFAYVYLGLAIAAFLLYWMAGMSPFHAINHAFTVVATGGFSTKGLSIAAFNSPLINIITIVFMTVASMHFGLLYTIFVTRSLKPLRNPIAVYYLSTLFVAGMVVSFIFKIDHCYQTWGESMMQGFFHVVSFTSTTGLAIGDNSQWPLLVNIILGVMGIVCGMAGSTTGGIKLDRFVLLMKAVRLQIHRSLHPASVKELRLSGRVLHEEDTYPHILYIGLFLVSLGISMVLFQFTGVDADNSFMITVSTLSNVGPAIGSMGTFGSFNGLSVTAKLLSCFNMFLGRVEMYPLLSVITMAFDRRR